MVSKTKDSHQKAIGKIVVGFLSQTFSLQNLIGWGWKATLQCVFHWVGWGTVGAMMAFPSIASKWQSLTGANYW
jgi:hypothetical protein